MSTVPRILCVGMATIDHVFRLTTIPQTATKVRANDYVRISGGMAANAAVAVSRLGGQATFWGPISHDANGEDILTELIKEGVNIDGVTRVDQRSAVSAILVDAAGERMVCGYSDPHTFDEVVALPLKQLANFDVVHADCRWWKTVHPVLTATKARRQPSVFDADLAPNEALDTLAPLASHAIFSQPGLARVTNGATPAEQLRDFSRRHPDHGLLAVTLGAEGVVWLEAGELWQLSVPPITSIDTLGAGDVFHGAWAYALGCGMNNAACARFASATAALKCTRFGGRSGTPSHAEVDALLAQWDAQPQRIQ